MRSGLRRLGLGGTAESRHMLATTLVVGALTATFVALLIPVQLFGRGGASAAAGTAVGEDDGRGVMSTQYGPLTPLDREFVRKVRLAGLWELPAGRQAQQRGTTPAVRMAGDHLVEGHTELDKLVIQVGRDVGVDLANQPTEEQRGWLAQLDAARGREYDRLFANLLRRAHGKVFSLVAQIRANSRNSMVRSLATRANTVVLDHITVLEDTGFVDFDALTDDKAK
ncbi:DUF4142 domain-containing protein [Streptomyces sp. XD-27]|uniref:DUF4142 domain-containing protein n=1 Tax=Streptomyces sp. XD-27 TaxID=3062779 RepID=UPI0026F44024|nr:DUF4142 domain-containing protein [Streptomyces sp. XD-27]WKX68868.1 DUF4142 domain-containing protein [Streptomyces sp. XD-27]